MEKVKAFADWLTKWFTVIVIVWAVFNYFVPAASLWGKAYTGYMLGIVLFGMGLTLTLDDFKRILTQPLMVIVGTVAHFIIMPLVAVALCAIFHLSGPLAVGVILVGCCPSGTSSNVMCYLAKGDVALSITMTALSTLLGVIITPLLVQLLAGKSVDVPVLDMLLSLLKIVLIPVVIGVLANVWLHSLTARLEPLLPLVSMVAIVLIIATVVALNAGQFAAIGPIVALAVILHNGIGITAGYWVSRWLGFDERICRTIAFEVGLQNSGLATALAMKFFTPASAVAGTLFSVWHNLSGSLLAGYWSGKPIDEQTKKDAVKQG